MDWKKVRYDRVCMVLIVPIILIALIVNAATAKNALPADGSLGSAGGTGGAAEPFAATVDNSKVVYLAPSNQYDNVYTGFDTTEKEQMRKIADIVKTYLLAEGIKVQVAGEDFSLSDKIQTANELGVGIYVSIHSNAGGGKGTEAFFNPMFKGSEELAYSVYSQVTEATPTPGRGTYDVYKVERDLDEIKKINMPGTLVEVEFHDRQETAEWIVNNTEPLARAIANGIIQYYNLNMKDTVTTTPETMPETVTSIDN